MVRGASHVAQFRERRAQPLMGLRMIGIEASAFRNAPAPPWRRRR